jgi:hypothetical protein
MTMQKAIMEFFLEKDITTLTLLSATFQLERIEWYKMIMQKKIGKLWKPLSLKKIIIART